VPASRATACGGAERVADSAGSGRRAGAPGRSVETPSGRSRSRRCRLPRAGRIDVAIRGQLGPRPGARSLAAAVRGAARTWVRGDRAAGAARSS